MRSISMAYVTPAFVARQKRVTRRDWNEKYATSFKVGERLEVLDRQRRFGGVAIGTLELREKPYLENIGAWSEKELDLYRDEGFEFMEHKLIVPEHAPLLKMAIHWIETDQELWVVPFDIIEVDEEAKRKYLTEVEIEKARNRLFKALTGVTIAEVTPKEAYILGAK